MAGGEYRCTALIFGPDKPPDSLGPCRVLWHPILKPVPVYGVSEALLALSDWADSVVFTSPRAPRFLYMDSELSGLRDRLQSFMESVTVYVIGPRTRGVVVELFKVNPIMPTRYRGVDLAHLMIASNSRRIVGVRSPDALRDMVRILVEKRAAYVEVYSYMVEVCVECLEGVSSVQADYLIVTSPMIARMLARRGVEGRYIAIGPTTAETLKAYSIEPTCVASEYTMDGVASCLAGLEGGE